MGVANESIGL